jgi:predicted nucleic acid-binding protein
MLDGAHAPQLLDVETIQTLRGLVRGGKLDLSRADLARTELRQLTLRRYPDEPLLRRCWELREVCTIYDGLYVALAEALDATLITRDARLGRSVSALVGVAGP